jgi:tetratricopeptide (TPR) repeat protein
MEEHDDALKVFQRALKLRRDEHDELVLADEIDESRLKLAKVLNNIGCVNFEKNALVAAKEAFDEAIVLQKSVFRNWLTLMCGMDTNSPGILTMASTMCNKAYVEIEQDNFESAISIFLESLKIQKAILGSTNKLVQSTLDNLGYGYVMRGQTDKALKMYSEIWEVQKDSHDTIQEKMETMKKMIVCHTRLEQWPQAFEMLELLEDSQQDTEPDNYKTLETTRKLMGEVNYQILKLPSLSDATKSALGCGICMGSSDEDIHLEAWLIPKPENTSKMSGHRVTHA